MNIKKLLDDLKKGQKTGKAARAFRSEVIETVLTTFKDAKDNDKLSETVQTVFSQFIATSEAMKNEDKKKDGKILPSTSFAVGNMSKILDGCLTKTVTESDQSVTTCSQSFRSTLKNTGSSLWTRFSSLDSAVIEAIIEVASKTIPAKPAKSCELCKVKDGQIKSLLIKIQKLEQKITALEKGKKKAS